MTTTISPSAGQGVLYTQQGAGTTPGYAALDDRRAIGGPLQEGVLGSSTLVTAGGVANVANADFMVTQRNAGANLSVDINMPAGGAAYVQGDTVSGQGLYCVPVHNATINETIAVGDPTNPRIDQVILEVQDNALDASGGNLARTRVIAGTPTVGATLANRLGAASLPGSALLLADILVGVSAGSVANAVIRDRRKWARGALFRVVRTNGANYTTTSTTFSAIDATNYGPRVELSGVPLRVTFKTAASDSNATNEIDLDLNGTLQSQVVPIASTTGQAPVNAVFTLVPSAGSTVVTPKFRTTVNATSTATIVSIGSYVQEFIIEELLRQASANNTVTSG